MDPIRWEGYIPDPTSALPADDPDEDLPPRYEWDWEPFLPEAAAEAEEAFQKRESTVWSFHPFPGLTNDNWALVLNYRGATSQDRAPDLQGGSPTISLGGNVTYHTVKWMFYHPPPAPQFQVRRRVVRTQIPRTPDTPIRKRARPRRFNPETGR